MSTNANYALSPLPPGSPARRFSGPPWRARALPRSSAIPAGPSCRPTTRCASFPSAMCWCATSKAPRTWPTAMRARRAKSAWPSPPAAPAPRTWSRASRRPCWIRCRSSASPAMFRARCWAPTRSRKSTSPASRCRSPSTTSSSTRPRTLRPHCAMRFRSRAPAAPARCSSTSPRTRSRLRRCSTSRPPSPSHTAPTPCCASKSRAWRRRPN